MLPRPPEWLADLACLFGKHLWFGAEIRTSSARGEVKCAHCKRTYRDRYRPSQEQRDV